VMAEVWFQAAVRAAQGAGCYLLLGAGTCMHSWCCGLGVGGTGLQAANVSLTQGTLTVESTHVWLSEAIKMPLCAGQ
jgi:hypothetical protein